MEDLNIIVKDIPTHFIKTEKYGDLKLEDVINNVWLLMDNEYVEKYDFDKNILSWLIDMDVAIMSEFKIDWRSGDCYKSTVKTEEMFDKLYEIYDVMEKLSKK